MANQGKKVAGKKANIQSKSKGNLKSAVAPRGRKAQRALGRTKIQPVREIAKSDGLVGTNTDAQWGVFCYLAGDLQHSRQADGGSQVSLVEAIERDVIEILGAGPLPDLFVAVQHDGPNGGVRYVLTPGEKRTHALVDRFPSIDSGSPEVFGDFLRWALSVFTGKRIAIVLNGLNALDPGHAEGEGTDLRSRVFTICQDEGSGNYMDLVELGQTIRSVLAETNREAVEMLLVDSCETQFLELAYELDGNVHVLVAPQTDVPGSGWDYKAVLKAWQAIILRRKEEGLPDGADELVVAEVIVPEIVRCYAQCMEEPCAVSALDLRRLDEVARAFDALSIGVMQVLGDGLIGKSRELLVRLFHSPKEHADRESYDCGSLFVLTSAVLEAMADEAVQGWLGTTLTRSSGRVMERFFQSLAMRIRQRVKGVKSHFDKGTHENKPRYIPGMDDARVKLLLETLDKPAKKHGKGSHGSEEGTFKEGGERLHKEIGIGVQKRLRYLRPGRLGLSRKKARLKARGWDSLLLEAVRAELSLLPEERQFDFQRLIESAETAHHLSQQAQKAARTLLGSSVEEYFDSVGKKGGTGVGKVVVALANSPEQPLGWPRWSGVSIYRPKNLNDLMNTSYQKFAFHQRVHWAALLGAINLIDHHPRALWRLVSSLLATGAPGTRRDLLRRLTGEDSVVWGLRKQFRVMAPAPSLTLSLERKQKHYGGDGEDGAVREEYLLRLESMVSGAVVTEQSSRVQPNVMNAALQELEDLLEDNATSRQMLNRLRAIGGLMGEDIFQALGRSLEEERISALEESNSNHAHLQLQIPRELMRYPWELMHHRGEWLSERFAMGRQVFMETGMARRVTRRKQGRVRPLIIGDPILQDPKWSQLSGARAEADQVADWFERLRIEFGEIIDFNRERDTRIHTVLTRAEFRELLRNGDYDIIHFAGHGVFHGNDPETSAWLLSDGQLWALEIRNTLHDHPAPPWLVYANACEAAMESGEPRRTYHGNVFGLATAFINQGVAAYIAPLWPIDDLLAQHIALEFYKNLLNERTTLGEALRRAKADARRLAYPEESVDEKPHERVWASLGWASLVLYGDPTEELFQALAGSGHRGQRASRPSKETVRDALPTPGTRPAKRPPARYLHTSAHVVAEMVSAPGLKPLVLGSRAGQEVDRDKGVLELVEEAGLRHWRVRGTVGSSISRSELGTRPADIAKPDPFAQSSVAKLLRNERVRSRLPGDRGLIRVLGRWILSGFEDNLVGLVRGYDIEKVKTEGLLHIVGDSRSMTPASRELFKGESANGKERVLLFIHGTFSKTASPVDGFGKDFLGWARRHYRCVLGFDHWTLSKDPLENAEMLVQQLHALDARLLKDRRLDIITHSRGGLVGRSFCELLKQAPAVKNLIFIGTPNCGTDMANPDNWVTAADVLVNFSGLKHADLYVQLAGFFAHLAFCRFARHLFDKGVPGAVAQNPLQAGKKGSFLNRLQTTGKGGTNGVRYSVVAADFEPPPLIPNLKGLWMAGKDVVKDTALDAFFSGANDLVVNTPHAWCIQQDAKRASHLPEFIPAERVLLYGPERGRVDPVGVRRELALGMHHCNLFGEEKTQEMVRKWLTEIDDRIR